MLKFKSWLLENAIQMSQYMDKGHPVAANFSAHRPEFKNSKPEKLPISSLRYGQSAIRGSISPHTKTKLDDPISVSKNHDGTHTIADGHHRVVAAIKAGKTHIMARVHHNTIHEKKIKYGEYSTDDKGQIDKYADPLRGREMNQPNRNFANRSRTGRIIADRITKANMEKYPLPKKKLPLPEARKFNTLETKLIQSLVHAPDHEVKKHPSHIRKAVETERALRKSKPITYGKKKIFEEDKWDGTPDIVHGHKVYPRNIKARSPEEFRKIVGHHDGDAYVHTETGKLSHAKKNHVIPTTPWRKLIQRSLP